MADDDLEPLVDEAVALLPALGRLLKGNFARNPELAMIPLGQARATAFLYQHGRSSVGEVAAGIGVSLATASELLDKLVDAGWAERGVNPADRRQVHLWLTPRAVQFADQRHAARRAQMSATLAKLDAADRPAFVRGLQALVETLDDEACSRQPSAVSRQPSA